MGVVPRLCRLPESNLRLFFLLEVIRMSEKVAFAHRFDTVTGSAIREIFKVIAQPGMISFAGGNPAASALPDELVSRYCVQVLQENGKAILQYGATEGYTPLVESLKVYLQDMLKIDIPAVLPVTGSTQAMDLLCKAFIDPGDVILVENPSFLGNMQCMKLYQANMIPLESDDEGIIIESLEKLAKEYHPKLLYIIPTFQNPTGKTLPMERRKKVAELASKYNFIVAEDDPYRDLRYSGEPLPSIKSFDTDGHVVFMGSFSKIISPGLRVGYMVGTEEIIRKCTIGKQSSDVHTSNLTQAVVDRFLRDNVLPGHIASICASYRDQMNAMLEELESFPAGTKWTKPQGGLFIWVELPVGLDALEILQKAIEKKVAFVPGTHFCADGGHENTLRLNFSNSSIEQIRTGMTALREIIAKSL